MKSSWNASYKKSTSQYVFATAEGSPCWDFFDCHPYDESEPFPKPILTFKVCLEDNLHYCYYAEL